MWSLLAILLQFSFNLLPCKMRWTKALVIIFVMSLFCHFLLLTFSSFFLMNSPKDIKYSVSTILQVNNNVTAYKLFQINLAITHISGDNFHCNACFFSCVEILMTIESNSRKFNYYFGQIKGPPTPYLHLPSPFLKGN